MLTSSASTAQQQQSVPLYFGCNCICGGSADDGQASLSEQIRTWHKAYPHLAVNAERACIPGVASPHALIFVKNAAPLDAQPVQLHLHALAEDVAVQSASDGPGSWSALPPGRIRAVRPGAVIRLGDHATMHIQLLDRSPAAHSPRSDAASALSLLHHHRLSTSASRSPRSLPARGNSISDLQPYSRSSNTFGGGPASSHAALATSLGMQLNASSGSMQHARGIGSSSAASHDDGASAAGAGDSNGSRSCSSSNSDGSGGFGATMAARCESPALTAEGLFDQHTCSLLSSGAAAAAAAALALRHPEIEEDEEERDSAGSAGSASAGSGGGAAAADPASRAGRSRACSLSSLSEWAPLRFKPSCPGTLGSLAHVGGGGNGGRPLVAVRHQTLFKGHSLPSPPSPSSPYSPYSSSLSHCPSSSELLYGPPPRPTSGPIPSVPLPSSAGGGAPGTMPPTYSTSTNTQEQSPHVDAVAHRPVNPGRGAVSGRVQLDMLWQGTSHTPDPQVRWRRAPMPLLRTGGRAVAEAAPPNSDSRLQRSPSSGLALENACVRLATVISSGGGGCAAGMAAPGAHGQDSGPRSVGSQSHLGGAEGGAPGGAKIKGGLTRLERGGSSGLELLACRLMRYSASANNLVGMCAVAPAAAAPMAVAAALPPGGRPSLGGSRGSGSNSTALLGPEVAGPSLGDSCHRGVALCHSAPEVALAL